MVFFLLIILAITLTGRYVPWLTVRSVLSSRSDFLPFGRHHFTALMQVSLIKSVWFISGIFALLTSAFGQNYPTSLLIPFDTHPNQTVTYHEAQYFYEELDRLSEWVQTRDWGMTDIGKPLQEVVVASQGHFTPEENKAAGKPILFIMNGIHPGEPEGIDASILLARDLVFKPEWRSLLDKITIVILPVYNIDGALNRSSHSRANQNGPESYGFRANARNLDLNRDFIKCDTENCRSFTQLFQKWKPHIMIDNHTSNGADYTYTMTLLPTQKDKIHPALGRFMSETMTPFLYKAMSEKKWDMTPYVVTRGDVKEGIYGFLETPRYSSGYAALHHTMTYLTETHMLKPFADRLWSTYYFMLETVMFLSQNAETIILNKEKALDSVRNQEVFPLSFSLNKTQRDSFYFKGYNAKYKKSEVTGFDRLYYDRDDPWDGYIPYYDTYVADISVKKPSAYMVPQAYKEVLELLHLNGVKSQRIDKDTFMEVTVYRINDFQTVKNPYEGHYLHYNTVVSRETKIRPFYKGDYVISTDQDAVRFIIETLEPQAPDSYWAWNFFDGIAVQKEYYSDYVFEDLAADLLRQDNSIAEKLEKKRKEDPEFANNPKAQLDFVYRNSPYYEPTHNLYPVVRIE